ncbi:CHAT domain-containing protein [Microcoleus sp. FACHB-672]|uniref:CHAT domain-containing protein n=1 Tax=Microcoleus sp. FACHB-672 TaxID=2692825 RepID=UPI0016856E27|nr:CHAT domain-containing tetratricopeptide repeat protein [Microcoleus sp. FACHB-672]MBD2041088.1 CHAT domain-containing protein [Microcoleus sp. FACHB-672]
MLWQIGQWFIRLWRRFIGLFRKPQSATPSQISATQPLSDAEYERLFLQLLVVVDFGMGEVEVLRAVERLKQRSSEAEWVAWLHRFASRLLESAAPNRELAERMVKLGEMACGELAEVAANIGRQLLEREAEKAVPVQPPTNVSEEAEALFNRAFEQYQAGNLDAALASYNRALEIEPTYHDAWSNRGSVLGELGRFEEALLCYNRAIEIEPASHIVWINKGTVLRELGRPEEALPCYNRAIEIEPAHHDAWNGKGNVLKNLGRPEEALPCYNRAIEIKPAYHQPWNGKGNVLKNLGRPQEAIPAYDRALELTKNQFWEAWAGRGWAILKIQGYNAALQNWDDGLQAMPSNEQEGGAFLHQLKADCHDLHGRRQPNPYLYWQQARDSYIAALKTLTNCQASILGDILGKPLNPRLRLRYLEILQKLAKVCKALDYQEDFQRCLDIGDIVLEDLINEAQSDEWKIQLSKQFAGFNQLRVLLLAQSPEPEKQLEALTLAEKRKNLSLRWLRDGWILGETPAFTLPAGVAALDWHLSEGGIVVFVLRSDRPLSVHTLTSPTFTEAGSVNTPESLVLAFETWMNRWKENYQKYRKTQKNEGEESPKDENNQAEESAKWRNSMADELKTLGEILQIGQILPQLAGIHHLILIPHRDLHLLPLEYFFCEQPFTISRLPSFQTGQDLQKVEPASKEDLLNVESPDPLLYAEIESPTIAHFYANCETVPHSQATVEKLTEVLQKTAGVFHFTGHAGHNIAQPSQSALQLKNKKLLTVREIFQLNLPKYYLVCLSACETGMTGKEGLIDEFVGLASCFLAMGTHCVISTLWKVDEISSALMMIRIHQCINEEKMNPIEALKTAQNWLRTVTYRDLETWYRNLADQVQQSNPSCSRDLRDEAASIQEDCAKIQSNQPPYEHLYYWAGFTVHGIVNPEAKT